MASKPPRSGKKNPTAHRHKYPLEIVPVLGEIDARTKRARGYKAAFEAYTEHLGGRDYTSAVDLTLARRLAQPQQSRDGGQE